MFGWEGDSLQRAMDTCTNGNGIPTDCKVLTVQGMNAMNQCKQHAKVPEEVEGTCTYPTNSKHQSPSPNRVLITQQISEASQDATLSRVDLHPPPPSGTATHHRL